MSRRRDEGNFSSPLTHSLKPSLSRIRVQSLVALGPCRNGNEGTTTLLLIYPKTAVYFMTGFSFFDGFCFSIGILCIFPVEPIMRLCLSSSCLPAGYRNLGTAFRIGTHGTDGTVRAGRDEHCSMVHTYVLSDHISPLFFHFHFRSFIFTFQYHTYTLFSIKTLLICVLVTPPPYRVT